MCDTPYHSTPYIAPLLHLHHCGLSFNSLSLFTRFIHIPPLRTTNSATHSLCNRLARSDILPLSLLPSQEALARRLKSLHQSLLPPRPHPLNSPPMSRTIHSPTMLTRQSSPTWRWKRLLHQRLQSLPLRPKKRINTPPWRATTVRTSRRSPRSQKFASAAALSSSQTSITSTAPLHLAAVNSAAA